MKKIYLTFICVFCLIAANAQFVITGKVLDNKGLVLPGAAVELAGAGKGAVSNNLGFFEIGNVNHGQYLLKVSFIGYKPFEQQILVSKNTVVDVVLNESPFMAEEVLIQATRNDNVAPGSVSGLNKTDIEKQNLGRDLPYLISLTPSVTVSSDAGAGVGYTGFRIRGTDANRINVTVNGIPINDAESQGTFWVNMPDFASSTQSIQVQRGAGTSTNGSAAFGASINMQTNTLQQQMYAELSSSAGSFNTFKNTIKAGSGLLANHFAVDARVSYITSDGYVDRGASNLKSGFVSAGYYAENTIVKLNVFSGKEKTYQSWNGIPKVRLQNDLEGMQRYAEHWLYSDDEVKHMINSDNRKFNLYTYNNETDNYQQDHVQLFFSQKIGNYFNLNTALHYTYGRGYYEQYKVGDDFEDYGMENVFIDGVEFESSDIIRQKWLDNDFYGVVASLNYKRKAFDITLGGAANNYDGQHFGDIIWIKVLGNNTKKYRWYNGTGVKADVNVYAKASYEIKKVVLLYADMQLRGVKHTITGIDDDLRDIAQQHNFGFFNPKGGIVIKPIKNVEIYGFYSRANREPNRGNFTDAPVGQRPKAELLNDFEFGVSVNNKRYSLATNVYLMNYRDQLVLTGQINDVGNAIMTNVEKSYRNGIELMAGVKVLDKLKIDANATFSTNKILNFTEYVDNWDDANGLQSATFYKSTDIAFSPNVIANGLITYNPLKKMEVSFISQYVGSQFIDNSSSENRMLEPYFVNNLAASYTINIKGLKAVVLNLQVNNIFNHQYESNAWVYSYIYENRRYEMDGYFTQAGINFLVGFTIKL